MASTSSAYDTQQRKADLIKKSKEIDNKEYSLSRAKDRAQNAATIATSVVYASLLKAILVKGPTTSYYVLSLTLIIIALTLQVIIGFLSVIMQNIDSYYRKYQGDVCEDFVKSCCCCFRALVQGSSKCCGGCGCCTCSSLSHYEAYALEEWVEWQKHYKDVEYNMKQLNVDIKYLDLIISTHGSQESITPSPVTTPPIPVDPSSTSESTMLDEHEHEDGNNMLDRIRALRMEKKFKVSEDQVNKETGQYLEERADNILQMDITKKLTVWQHIANYLLYFVFVLNAFITAFSLAGNSPK